MSEFSLNNQALIVRDYLLSMAPDIYKKEITDPNLAACLSAMQYFGNGGKIDMKFIEFNIFSNQDPQTVAKKTHITPETVQIVRGNSPMTYQSFVNDRAPAPPSKKLAKPVSLNQGKAKKIGKAGAAPHIGRNPGKAIKPTAVKKVPATIEKRNQQFKKNVKGVDGYES